jgi:CcmD family protein
MTRRLLAALGASTTCVAIAAAPLLGQVDRMGFSGLGRPYWHVFAAYAIAVLLVAGWVISIARRLGRIERRLGDLGEGRSADR